METRPKINLILSLPDKFLEGLSKLLLFIMLALTVYTLIKSPENVPTHFNASGQADSYGNKKNILILPALGTIIYFGITWLNKYPQSFNYLTKITVENAQQQYSIATRMLRFLKVVILLLFILIILFTYLTSIGVANGIGDWILPLALFLLLTPTIFLIIRSVKTSVKKI